MNSTLPATDGSPRRELWGKGFYPAASLGDDLDSETANTPRDVLRSVFGGALLVMDAILWPLSFSLAVLTLHLMGTPAFLPNVSVLALPFFALGAVLYAIGGYDRRENLMSLEFTSLYLIAMAVAVPMAILLVYVFGTSGAGMQPSRALLPIAMLYFSLMALQGRRTLFRLNRGSREGTGNYLVISDNPKSMEIFQESSPNKPEHFHFGEPLATLRGR